MPPLGRCFEIVLVTSSQHRLSAYHPNEPISHKHAVGVSVRKKLQCRDSGFVQSTLRIGA